MNKKMRKYGKMAKKNESEDSSQRTQSPKRSKDDKEFEEVLPPRSKRDLKGKMLNRCCYVVPDQRSFGQHTDTYSQVEHASQYFGGSDHLLKYVDCEPWANANTAVAELKRDEETLTQYHNLPKTCRISDTPRVKVIAENFTKYKKNNIELRKLEERVVCVEYDVFDDSVEIKTKPVQKMRAFFAIKPIDEKANLLSEMPSAIKKKFNISRDYLQNPNQKEIEIADGTITENQSYLDDLRKILRRRQNSKKCNNNINLQTLYEIAKRELLETETDFDLETLTKDEMREVRNLILKNCKSSLHGIRRRTFDANAKASNTSKENCSIESTISRSLLKELLRIDSLQ